MLNSLVPRTLVLASVYSATASPQTSPLKGFLQLAGFGMPDPRTGHIVVEMRTPHSAALLKYSCSKRVLALPTVQLNARR